nr:MAG TPA: hypothetical protein [Caudoviricetes sp.]
MFCRSADICVLVPLQCKSGVHSQNRPQLCSLHLTSQSRVQGSNLLVPTDHGIKTPPDEKG